MMEYKCYGLSFTYLHEKRNHYCELLYCEKVENNMKNIEKTNL